MAVRRRDPSRGCVGLVLLRLLPVGHQVRPDAVKDTTVARHSVRFEHHLVPGPGRQALKGSRFYPRSVRARLAHRTDLGETRGLVRYYVRHDPTGIPVDALDVRGNREGKRAGNAIKQ